MTVNPNFPVLDYAISWPNGPQQSCLQPYWCSVGQERSDATYGGSTTWQRGKQYWLDQVQPGMMNLSLTNKDGAFDPANPTSPYTGFVLPYRLFRMRAQWPPTDNLLTQNQATAGEAATSIGSLSLANLDQVEKPWAAGTTPPAWCVLQNAVSPTTVAASGSAWQGGQVFNHAVQSAAAYPFNAVGMQGWSVAGGKAHAFTTHARAAAGITATAAVAVQWLDASGALISTSTGTPSTLATGSSPFTTLTLASTAPANAAAAVAYLSMQTGPAATSWTLQSDGWDVRKGTSTPAYITPGTWFPMFTGYVSGFPQRWVASGLYGVTDLTIVDEFAVLSQRNLLAPFKADLMALSPNFLYALDETAGTNVYSDLTNKRGPAIMSRANLGNTMQSGSSLASADNAPPGPDRGTAVTGAFLGGAGPVVHSQAIVSSDGYEQISGSLLIPASPSTGLTGVPQSGGFTRLIAVRATSLQFDVQMAWAAADPTGAYGLTFYLFMTLSGSTLLWNYNGSSVSPTGGAGQGFGLPLVGTGTDNAGTVTSTLYDGDWHLLGISLSPDGKTVTYWNDGAPAPITNTFAASARPPAGNPRSGYTDTIGALNVGLAQAGDNWLGDLAFACELPFAMDAATWANLAQSWRNAWSTTGASIEASSTRYQRILTWLNYVGPARLSTGVCKAVGPATDVAVNPTSPTAGLQALQNVVDTENGQHFIGADGAVVFQSRADRYNKTALVTFGEKAALGEVPYLDVQTDHDTSRVANDVQVTAQYGTALYRQQDATSQGRYGAIQLQRTVNSVDPNELTAAAQALLLWNKDPQQRVKTLTVDPSSNPGIWPMVLAAELGLPCQVNRRPQGATQISLPGFIEQISGTFDGKTNQMLVTFQITPNTNRAFPNFDTARFAPDPGSMTLQAGITAGQTTLAIATAGGSPTMTNTAGSYPFDIIVDSEQITLTAAPGGTTSPQTFTVTRAVNGTTAAAHSAGAAVTLAAAGKWAY